MAEMGPCRLCGLDWQWWLLPGGPGAEPEGLGRAVQWQWAWLALLSKQERMHREAPKPPIQLVNIPAPGNGDEPQLVPERETQMSLCLSHTCADFFLVCVNISEMPVTLERVSLPQPRCSCWQPLGCLCALC